MSKSHIRGSCTALKSCECLLHLLLIFVSHFADSAFLPTHCHLIHYKQFGYGWNAATNKYLDLMEDGVVDPAKVTINAIENSASVAGLVLTTECLVTEIPVFESEADMQARFDAEGMGAGMGMQGM